MAIRRKLKHKRLIYVFCLVDLIILIAAFVFVIHDYIGQLLAFLDLDVDRQLLKTVFRDHGIEDAFFLLLLTITTTAIPFFSSSVVCIFNGACFGPYIGFLMSLCGSSLGNLCMWLLFTRYDLPKRSQKLEEFIAEIEQHKQKIYGIIAGYMMPMFPSFIVNYVSVHLKLSVPTAISCIVIGMVPTSFIYSFGGNAIFEGSKALALGALAGFVILFSVVFIYRKWRKQRKNNA